MSNRFSIKEAIIKSRPETRLTTYLSYLIILNLALFSIAIIYSLALGKWNNFHMIYYTIPLLLGYYTYYTRNYLETRLDEIGEEKNRVKQLYKIGDEKALRYTVGKIENEVIGMLTKFTAILIAIILLILWLFSI